MKAKGDLDYIHPTDNEYNAINAFTRFARYFKFRQFLERVIIGTPDECWKWKGKLTNSYGTFQWKSKHIHSAHVASYNFFVGSIPKRHGKRKLYVCHSCDNPACVNPHHLWLGTHKQNMEDMFKKKRNVVNSGEDHGCAKITLEIVEKIRKKYKTGYYTQQELAERYGIDQTNVSLIVRNKAWVN